MNDTCKVQVSDGGRMMSSHVCGRKLSGSDDYPELCGTHAAAKRRRQAKDNYATTRRAEIGAEREGVENRAAAVAEKLEVSLTVETRYPTTGPDAHLASRATGNVVVGLAELEALVERVRNLTQENARRRLGEL